MKWLDKKDTLISLLIEQNKSYEEVGRLYNVSGTAIKKACKRLQIEIPKRRKINPKETFGKGTTRVPTAICKYCGKEFPLYSSSSGNFCSLECFCKNKHQEGYKKLLIGDPEIMKANYKVSTYKDIILEEQNNQCAICGMLPTWNNKTLIFVLDHIDGHAANNKRDNLRLICPNCDSQLDTYKSKNKKSDRTYYHFNYRK